MRVRPGAALARHGVTALRCALLGALTLGSASAGQGQEACHYPHLDRADALTTFGETSFELCYNRETHTIDGLVALPKTSSARELR